MTETMHRRGFLKQVSGIGGGLGLALAAGPGLGTLTTEAAPAAGLTVCASYTDLMAASAIDGGLAWVGCREAPGDGGEGVFRFAAASADVPNGGTIVGNPNSAGRWQRVYSGPINVRWFGARGDGAKDDTAAIVSAISAAGSTQAVFVPAGSYVLTAQLSLPKDACLMGEGKFVTTLLHSYNGDFADVGGNVTIADLTIDGQGAIYSGKGLVYQGSNGAQTVRDCQVIEFADACFYYETGAGSRSNVTRVTTYRHDGGSGSSRYAVVVDPAQQLRAVPRSFVQLDTCGNCAFDFGGCCNVFVSASTFGDCRFTAESRSVNISSSRWLNQTSCVVDGHNNSIIGCDINPQLTINAGADLISLGPGSFNHLPVIDASGNDRNNITHGQVPYSPSLSCTGVAPNLGNGTLVGHFARTGNIVNATVNLTLGSTTSLGRGELRFSLPVPRANGTIETCGGAVMLAGSTNYTGMVQIPGNVGYARIVRDGSGVVTSTSPVTFRSGDTIRLTFSYTL